MAGLNVVALNGNLVRDPELKSLPSGTSVCKLRIAVDGGRKDASGIYQKQSHFFDVTVFGGQAENTAKFMHKGSPVGIQGRLEYRQWETPEGGKRDRVEIVASNVEFLGSKNGGDPDPSPRSDVPATVASDDDIPF